MATGTATPTPTSRPMLPPSLPPLLSVSDAPLVVMLEEVIVCPPIDIPLLKLELIAAADEAIL